MNNRQQGRTPIYESSFKIALAREYLTGNLGYKALAKKYGLAEHHTVRHFVKWYKQHYPQGESVQPEEIQQDCLSQPQSDNHKQLSRQLTEANLKIAGLEILIENAQKELGVDIIKKSGTKPSHK